MTYKDYYKILNVEKSATQEEIKSAYRKLAVKYHPDKNAGDRGAEERFKEINEAHAVLSDPEKRKKYDQFGQDWKHYHEAGKENGFDWSKYSARPEWQTHTTGNQNLEDLFGQGGARDFFEMLFGYRFGDKKGDRHVSVRGQDVSAHITMTLEEAYHGTTQYLSLNGQTLKVNVKPGIGDGQVLRLSGKGGPGFNGGERGDLYLNVRLTRHPEYQRKGNNLYRDFGVDLYTAMLGGRTVVKTFKGNVKVNIPPETENGKVLRLTGLGMPIYNEKNRFGDLFVRVTVLLPGHLTEEERSIFEKLRKMRRV